MADELQDRNSFHLSSFRRWFTAESFLALTSSTALATTLTLVGVTGSAAIAGVVTGCITAAEIFLGLLGGGLSDHYDRRALLRRTAAVSTVANVALVVLLAVFTFMPNDSRASVGHAFFAAVIIVLLFIPNALTGLADPVLDSSVKMLITSAQFPRAMGAAYTRSSTLSIVGGPLAGALYGFFAPLPFAMNALCEGAFILTLRKIPENLGPHIPSGDTAELTEPARLSFTKILMSYRESLAFLRSEEALFRVLIAAPLVNLMVFSGTTWTVLHLSELHIQPLIVGTVTACFALGSFMGSLLTGWLTDRIRPGILASAGLAWMVVAFAVLFSLEGHPLGLGLAALACMLPSPALNAGLFGHVFQRTEANMQGRVMATFGVVGGLASVIAPMLAGFTAQSGGAMWLGIATCLIGVVGVAVLLSSKAVRAMERA